MNTETIFCAGAWCKSRQQCANHFVPLSGPGQKYSERICAKGEEHPRQIVAERTIDVLQGVAPWDLSPAEIRAFNAVCDTGSVQLASVRLGISCSAIEHRTAKARKKMGARLPLTGYLMWDRYRMESSDGKLPKLQHGQRKP